MDSASRSTSWTHLRDRHQEITLDVELIDSPSRSSSWTHPRHRPHGLTLGIDPWTYSRDRLHGLTLEINAVMAGLWSFWPACCAPAARAFWPFLHIFLPLIGLKSRFKRNWRPKMVENVVFSTENLLSPDSYWKYIGKSKILEKFFLSRKSCFYDVGRYFASKSSFWVQMDRFGEKSIFWSKIFFAIFGPKWPQLTQKSP